MENTEWAIKNEKPEKQATKDTQDEERQKHNTLCVGHHYKQTNTFNINKTCDLLHTTGSKDEPNIIFIQKL